MLKGVELIWAWLLSSIVLRIIMEVKPIIWQIAIGGHAWPISPYLLFNGIGLIVALFLLYTILASKFPNYQNKMYNLFVFSIVFGWSTAYIFDWLTANMSFSQSGFTFYGGLIGGCIFYISFSYKLLPTKLVWPSLDVAVIPFLCGHAFGRIGCYFAGCCYGRVIPANNPLSFLFNIHPTQLYESFFLFVLALFLFNLNRKYPLSLLKTYLVSYSLFRFHIEFLRADPRLFFGPLSISQWISLVLLFSTITVIFNNRFQILAHWYKKEAAGLDKLTA